MRVGTIVQINKDSFINKAGEIGVVYEDYGSGSAIIFESGEYDGFSDEELSVFDVKKIGFSKELSSYKFTNVQKVSLDYDNKVFNQAFKEGKKLV